MKKNFFNTCSIVSMCLTSVFSIGSLIAGIATDGYHLYAFSFGMAIITLSLLRDYIRETPRKKITVHINSFNRVQQTIASLNMDVIINQEGEWVEIVYPEIESERLTRLLFRNQVKIHN
ncbi:MAG TPA: hypothetical protein VIK29_07090 [Paludibacter sp.]